MRRVGALEPLGLLLRRESALRPPASAEVAPIPARDWEAAVGSRIAARARPARLERGLLSVRVATSVWAQELSLLTEPILAELRARGFRVSQLRFRVGPVDAPERPPQRDEVRKAPPEAPLPPEIAAQLAHIPDPELREAIAHAAARNLGWQTALENEGPGPRGRKRPRGRAPAPAAAPATPVGPTPAAPRVPPEPAPPTRPRPRAAGPEAPATSAPSGAPAPRSAGTGSAPPDRTTGQARAAPRGKP